MIDENFRCDAIEMSRAIKNDIDAKHLTLDALFEHLQNTHEETRAFVAEYSKKS